MTFDEDTCQYSVLISGIKENFSFEWKVTISNAWTENYGCGKGNCIAKTDQDGAVRLIFKPESLQLTSDYNFVLPTVDPNAPTTTRTTTKQVLVNPVKPCESDSCPPCTNNFKNKLLRVSGDWSIDAGSPTLWNAAEPKGLLTFDENRCEYDVVVTGLKNSFSYKWKLVTNNAWAENYGCTGLAAADCTFKSNNIGSVRFVVKPTNPPKLTTDYNVFTCGGKYICF